MTLSVELHNPGNGGASGELSAKISGVAETLKRQVKLYRGETRTETFTVKITNPRIWWPIFKGEQPLYRATFTFADRNNRDEIATDFGIRTVTSDQNTPDKSRLFYVNNRPFFVRGSNWIPDAMLRTDDAKLEAEIRYTAQSGINMLRLWGGGIVEREKFYELCDKYGILRLVFKKIPVGRIFVLSFLFLSAGCGTLEPANTLSLEQSELRESRVNAILAEAATVNANSGLTEKEREERWESLVRKAIAFRGKGRRLAGGSDRGDAFDAVFDLPFDQIVQRLEIHRSVLVERGD